MDFLTDDLSKYGFSLGESTGSSTGFADTSLSGGGTNGGLPLEAMGVIGMANNVFNDLIGMDPVQEFGNVLKYGLNSWGASSTPESIGLYLKDCEAFVGELSEKIQSGDIDALNELDRYVNWGYQFYTRMRNNHAKATSTQKAYDLAKAFFLKMINDVLNPIVSGLKSKGLLNSSSVSQKANMYVIHSGELPYSSDPAINYSVHSINEANYIKAVETLQKDSEKEIETITQNGEVVSVKSQASFGWLAIILLVLFGGKLLKK